MKKKNSDKKLLLSAADQCRAIQQTYLQQARKSRRKDIKEFLRWCAAGAGACAADIEARAGLTFDEMVKRAVKKAR
jgi:hypothetical protein